MKILYLESYGDMVGGGQRSLLNLLRKLDRDEFIPLVLVPSQGTLTTHLDKIKVDFKILPLPSVRGWRNLLIPITLFRLLYLTVQEKIDLIHSNTTNSAFYGVIVSRILKIPHIWWVRVTPKLNLTERIISRLTAHIAVVSRFVGRRLPKHKLSVIYNGVDIEEFKPTANYVFRDELNIPKEVFLVGTVGQLLPYKGHKILIQAVKKVIEREENILFLIIGEERVKGYKRELISTAESLGIEDKILFTGFRKDIPRILNSLDLFVFPSIVEHFARVILEAMACGKAIVATRSGGTPEAVEDKESGILVRPGNADELSGAIISLKRNPQEIEKLGTNAKNRVASLFRIERNVESTQKIYRRLSCRREK